MSPPHPSLPFVPSPSTAQAPCDGPGQAPPDGPGQTPVPEPDPDPVDPGARPPVDPEGGRDRLLDRAAFDALARRDDVPGALGVREVKFLATGVDAEPTFWFIDTTRYQYHFDFARDALGVGLSLAEFNRRTYFSDRRSFMAGSLLAHDAFHDADGTTGLYTLEFFPTDPVSIPHVALAWRLVLAGMPWARSRLAYHPAGQVQQQIVAADPAALPAQGVRVIDTQALFSQVRYSPLNLGEGYGTLRVVDPADRRPPTVRDVVIFKAIPNDLAHVAGVLTEQPQTPLSHINLKAKQNDTPNAYLRDAASDPRVVPLLGREVFFAVRPDDIELRAATPAEVQAHLDAIRPKDPQTPRRDLSRTTIVPLARLGHGDLVAFGAKVANVAELRKFLPDAVVPDGFGVPFWFYDVFMTHTGLYTRAREVLADADFQADPAVREEALAKLRKKIEKAEVPAELADALHAMHQALPPGTNARCRSSTNNEDLEGFNGAGLYDSYTHRADEGHITKTIKQVWASLWSFRAFEEREFYRIDHFVSAMGVLVHPNFDDERVNGVAVTKNLYDPQWEGIYINVQVGEALVTNPDPNATPDEILVQRLPPDYVLEVLHIRHSSLVAPGATVMTRDELEGLVTRLEEVQRHFAPLYGHQPGDGFAMDVEFKIDVRGDLVIKQARPWVE
jgi:pyruvate, water dikinase